jgi:DNA-binding NarL/FixJ family response regulator
MYHLILADNQPLYIQGIISSLKSENWCEIDAIVDSKEQLFKRLSNSDDLILIIDFETVVNFLITDFSIIQTNFPLVKVLVLSASNNKDHICHVLKYSIKGYLQKSCDVEEFNSALLSVSKNKTYYGTSITELIIRKKSSEFEIPEVRLTPKEVEIVKLLALGYTTKIIADRIFISHHTVNTHRKNILRKLQINNTSELLMYAIKNGIVYHLDYNI